MKCHMCDSETDWVCRDCDQPVCDGCVVQMTIHNQIDYTLCQECQDGNEAADYLERSKVWAIEEAKAKKKEVRRKARRVAYYKPEAIEKRRLAKIARLAAAAELRKKQMAETFSTVSKMFKGMF